MPLPTGCILLGRYVVEELLGSGGQAEVYRVLDEQSGETLALKTWTGVREEEAQQALEEFRILARLQHPGIVPVRAAGFDASLKLPVVAMELVRGQELVLACRGCSSEALEILTLRLLEGLAHLHRQGVVHGDLKPANIMVRNSGGLPEPVLLDFGLAGEVRERSFLGGTPAYLAPEVAAGGPPSFAADLYALGLSLLQAALGEDKPRQAPPKDEPLPPLLQRLLPRLLHPRPERRFQDAAQALALARWALGAKGVLWPPARLPFMGRERSLTELGRYVVSLKNGQQTPTLVIVDGPPGSGRSRLLEEVRRRECTRGVPLLPWTNEDHLPLLLKDLAHSQNPLSQNPSEELQALWQPHPGALPAADASALPERAAGWLLHHLGTTPVVLMGPAPRDPDSELASFLGILVRWERAQKKSGQPPRLLLLLSGNTPWLKALQPERVLKLRPLGEAPLRRLLASVTGSPPTDPLLRRVAAALLARSGGWPLLVAGFVSAMLQRGILSLGPSGLRFDEQAWEALRPPRDAGEVLVQSFQSLRKEEQTLAVLCSLQEGGLTAPALAEVAQLPVVRVLQAVLHLKELGWLKTGFQRHLRSWAAAGQRPFLEGVWPRETLAPWHLRLANVTAGPDRLRHLVAGGERPRGVALLEAVAALLKRGSARQARTLARDSLQGGLLSAVEREEMELMAAGEELRRGQRQEARACLARLSGSPRSSVAARAARRAAEAALMAGDQEQTLQLMRLAVARSGNFKEEGAQNLSALAYILMRRGKLAQAARAAARALSAAPAKSLARGAAEHVAGLVARRQGLLAQGIEHLRAAQRLLKGGGDDLSAAVAAGNLGAALMGRGAAQEARHLFQEALAVFEERAQLRRQAQVQSNLGVLENLMGRNREAVAAHDRARVLAEAAGDEAAALLAQVNQGIARFDGGQPGRALPLFALSLPKLARQGDPLVLALARAHLSRTLARLGRQKRARVEALRSLSLARSLGNCRARVEALLALSDCSKTLRARRRRLRQALEMATRDGFMGLAVETCWLLSECALKAGREPEAREMLEQAAAVKGGFLAQHPGRLWLEARVASTENRPALLAKALHAAVRSQHFELVLAVSMQASILCLRKGRLRRALSLYRRARGAVSTLEESMSRKTTALHALSRGARELEEMARGIETRLAFMAHAEEQHATLEMFSVMELLKELSAATSMKRLLARIMESALSLTGAQEIHILLLGPQDKLRCVASRFAGTGSIPRSRIRVSTSISHEVIALGRPLIVDDAQRDNRYQELLSVGRHEIHSLACLPLGAREQHLGALYLDGGSRPRAFRADRLPLYEAFASLAALAIQNLRRYQEARAEGAQLDRKLRSERALSKGRLQEARRLAASAGEGPLVGRSLPMQRVRDLIERFGQTHLPVLVTGASGTGKELVARALHETAGRPGPLVVVNCAALPEQLFESILFGHVKGAFTGASENQPGLFAQAAGGSLFLDEVGELPRTAQAKLLRVLEDGRIRPVGGSRPVRVDVRILSASHRDLKQEVAARHFREDLYFRLAVLEIHLPPLQERREDIPLLVEHFLRDRERKLGVAPPAMSALLKAPWPGNVRELRNELERARALAEGADIRLQDLSSHLRGGKTEQALFNAGSGRLMTLQELERRALQAALQETGGHRGQAARLLGIARSTLYSKLRLHGMDRENS